jgi:periplasmic protein TonB
METKRTLPVGKPVGYPVLSIQNGMADRTNPWAFGTAAAMNAGMLALMILMGMRTTIPHLPLAIPASEIHLKDLSLIAPAGLSLTHGGGSGGTDSLIDPAAGHLPPRAANPIVPPQEPVIQHPLLAIDAAISVPAEVKLPDNPTLQHIGASTGPIVQLVSGGPGTQGGIGAGSDGGDGPGKGIGYGPGSDRGAGGEVYSPGTGGVSSPMILYSSLAEFSDEARRHKYEGVCIVSIIVDAHGNPTHLHVARALGMGLDEKAMEAVAKYRFKPAMKNGRPVASYVNVEINFHLY